MPNSERTVECILFRHACRWLGTERAGPECVVVSLVDLHCQSRSAALARWRTDHTPGRLW